MIQHATESNLNIITLSKFHKDPTINATSRVLTSFYSVTLFLIQYYTYSNLITITQSTFHQGSTKYELKSVDKRFLLIWWSMTHIRTKWHIFDNHSEQVFKRYGQHKGLSSVNKDFLLSDPVFDTTWSKFNPEHNYSEKVIQRSNKNTASRVLTKLLNLVI